MNVLIVHSGNAIAQSSDLWTMFIKIGLIGLRNLVDGLSDAHERQLAITKAAIEYKDTLHQIELESANTIFGQDSVRQYAETIKYLKSALSDLESIQNRMSNITRKWSTGTKGGMVNVAHDIMELYGRSMSDEKAMEYWRSAMAGGYKEYQEFYEWLIANKDAVRDKLAKGDRADFDALLENLDAYKNALEDYESMMQDVFGDIAGTLADSLINAFVESGDAATDLANNMEETFSELGKDIARSLISSFIINNILDKYKDVVESLFTSMSDSSADPDVIAQKFGELADNITQDADAAAQFTNALLTALQTNGIDLSSEGGTKAMSNGIKSITEDTANLLASYINAIRADVSVTRTMIATILGLLPSAPTLSEYLAQIQANTYNTAVNTQFILERLDSTMAAFPNGGRAFNVNIS